MAKIIFLSVFVSVCSGMWETHPDLLIVHITDPSGRVHFPPVTYARLNEDLGQTEGTNATQGQRAEASGGTLRAENALHITADVATSDNNNPTPLLHNSPANSPPPIERQNAIAMVYLLQFNFMDYVSFFMNIFVYFFFFFFNRIFILIYL